MDVLESALVDLARLGMKGDEASVRRLTKQLLRRSEGLGAELREALSKLVVRDASGRQLTRRAQAKSRDLGEGSPFVTVERMPRQDRPVLDQRTMELVEQTIREHERSDELGAAGLEPTRTLLLVGPPGVGKTMTARFIASELGLPLVSVDLTAVMSSYLGATGQNLRTAIEFARDTPCVLLLDEFDAIAKKRGDLSDVGELKRIVNVLLIELEQWLTRGLVVAATNHPELLDRAIWRRFERHLTLANPVLGERSEILTRLLEPLSVSLSGRQLEIIAAAAEGCSGSDLATLVREASRRAVLDDDVSVPDALALLANERLLSRSSESEEARQLYCVVAHRIEGATQREIAGRLGVSHVTVGKAIRAWESGADARNKKAPKAVSGRRR